MENRIAATAAGKEMTIGHFVPLVRELIKVVAPADAVMPSAKPIRPPQQDNSTDGEQRRGSDRGLTPSG